MFCTKCGKEIPDGTECDCTQQQPQQQPEQQQPQQPQQPPQQPPQQQFQQQPPPQQQYQQPQQPPPQQFQQPPPQQQPYVQAPPADNRKLFSILAYIPLLFLVGMFSPYNNEQRVRFHVGQGIILTIYWGACQIVTIILSTVFGMIFRSEIRYFGIGTGVYQSSWVAGLLSTVLWLATYGSVAFLAITTILNVNKNYGNDVEMKPLPIIGNFAFYK